jgi:hypothetical protein
MPTPSTPYPQTVEEAAEDLLRYAGPAAGPGHPVVALAASLRSGLAAHEAATAEAAYRPGNALYSAIVKEMEPHFPAGSRDLDWDVLPGTIGQVCRERAAIRDAALTEVIAFAESCISRTGPDGTEGGEVAAGGWTWNDACAAVARKFRSLRIPPASPLPETADRRCGTCEATAGQDGAGWMDCGRGGVATAVRADFGHACKLWTARVPPPAATEAGAEMRCGDCLDYEKRCHEHLDAETRGMAAAYGCFKPKTPPAATEAGKVCACTDGNRTVITWPDRPWTCGTCGGSVAPPPPDAGGRRINVDRDDLHRVVCMAQPDSGAVWGSADAAALRRVSSLLDAPRQPAREEGSEP